MIPNFTNQIQGIATGFRCFIPAHKLSDIVESQIAYLKTGKPKKIKPWYKGYGGEVRVATNENGSEIMYTTFGFKWEGESLFLTHAPQTWNRDKVVALLEDMIEKKDNWYVRLHMHVEYLNISNFLILNKKN